MRDEDTTAEKGGGAEIDLTGVPPEEVPALGKDHVHEKHDEQVHVTAAQIDDKRSNSQQCPDDENGEDGNEPGSHQ
jgi:hypothetical protein